MLRCLCGSPSIPLSFTLAARIIRNRQINIFQRRKGVFLLAIHLGDVLDFNHVVSSVILVLWFNYSMTQSLEHDLKLLTYLAIIYPTMKEKLLDLTDLLTKRKDVEGLTLLRHITLELLSSGYEIKGLKFRQG